MIMNRKSAQESFEMYVELIKLISEIEPKLIATACKALKKRMFPNFNLKSL